MQEEILMADLPKRLQRERKTIEVMINMYCDAHHAEKPGLCDECSELMDYANKRLDKCRFQEDKPVCSKCTVHCYKPSMREKVLKVMRYAGPRMLKKHPGLAIKHLIDTRKKPVDNKKEKG